MSPSINRSLGVNEITKLISVAKAAEIDAKSKMHSWPGTYNLGLIADAVNNRRRFVDLEPSGKRFSIKYDERAKAVFLKPSEKGFVPCGWWTYDELKRVLDENY